MGPTEISGLPAHVLIVHFVVVAVPLTAALLVTAAFWPAARRRLGAVLPVAALATLVSVPLATNAGEWLEKRVTPDPLVRAHVRLGDTLLPWAIGLFVVAAAVWATEFLTTRAARPATVPAAPASDGDARAASAPVRSAALNGVPVRIALAVLALVVATGSVVQVYRIGESGSRAAWHDASDQQPASGD
jgi:hypothetical protein